ncbi:DUF4864 domain-containing protein [Cypionkella sp.]|uniref:DUF4864 domain-containing protein n=1 Tax=Cypionkella sp. TaxID=2811411 RepID=UPI002ABC02DF|nr:DUF4864 domain-containing protein [Cypionkella sp.]MDZ4392442.1 DUF4864 domain-containing protein [Cypionkella sp.]
MRLYLYMAALVVSALPVAAQDTPIQNTIQNQLDAFNAQDVGRAWSYASPTIKGIFGTEDNFGTMVQKAYPMVWQHEAVRMLELRTVAGNLWQRVMITDTGGRTYLLDYMMVETPEGWQINAVQLLPQQGVGA